MQQFASASDAHKKLHRAIITYNGHLYVCQGKDPRAVLLNNMMTLVPLAKGSDQPIEVDYTDNGFQAIHYELGFMNRRNLDCIYVTRSPVRNSNVGISIDYLCMLNAGSRSSSPLTNNLAYSKEFQNMLFNKYPTFEEALATVKKSSKNGSGVAFNKYFALYNILDDEDEPQVCLYHMHMTRLGRLNPSTGKFDTNNRSRKGMLTMITKTGMIPNEYI